ncbi:MAG: hypothetical protein IKH78_02600 [Ruminococcus sp.]|nr:hypothetical protein [Ruminococcus sp.]
MDLVILDLLIAALFIAGAVVCFYRAFQMSKAKKAEKEKQQGKDKY